MSCQYVINNLDQIVLVNDEWNEFALANKASHLLREKVLNQSIWKFINDLTFIFFYREILKKVRAGRDFKFNIRCDSANSRRFLEVNITLQTNGDVLFENHILKMETRSGQIILNSGIFRSDEMLIICSWCNRINIGKEKWQDTEKAIQSLRLFEKESCPNLSHGMCPDCYQVMSKKLDEMD